MRNEILRGSFYATPGALETFSAAFLSRCRDRHIAGDWAEMSEEDQRANQEALVSGARLFSRYTDPDTKKVLWIISEARDRNGRRSATTFLLPSEY